MAAPNAEDLRFTQELLAIAPVLEPQLDREPDFLEVVDVLFAAIQPNAEDQPAKRLHDYAILMSMTAWEAATNLLWQLIAYEHIGQPCTMPVLRGASQVGIREYFIDIADDRDLIHHVCRTRHGRVRQKMTAIRAIRQLDIAGDGSTVSVGAH